MFTLVGSWWVFHFVEDREMETQQVEVVGRRVFVVIVEQRDIVVDIINIIIENTSHQLLFLANGLLC